MNLIILAKWIGCQIHGRVSSKVHADLGKGVKRFLENGFQV